MGCPVPVHCRWCNEPLDVYQPFEERFCCEDCADQYQDSLPECPLCGRTDEHSHIIP